GKSTLLRLLAGELRSQAGRIDCAGRPLAAWSARELARLRAVLPQREQLSFGFTVEEVVHLGRLPCPQHSPQREREIVRAALDTTGVSHLRARRYPSLSGGERARVQLARVLAQIWEPVELGPRTLLLDEPTASLDLAHQHRCLAVARRFAAQDVAVVVVLHDPNLVMAYADRVTLLCCGETIACGTPQEVLTPHHLSRVYGVEVTLLASETAARPYIAVHVPR
ncbi:MAG: heme ABC transporter ATP-binding protein, partial [Gammaproteobacteria bacterium]